MINIVNLKKTDINSIIEMEKKAWIEGAQVSRKKLEERFKKKHHFLGAIEDNKLTGLLAYSHTFINPENLDEEFPKTFEEFSSKQTPKQYNATFAYNLSIIPEKRTSSTATTLISTVLKHLRKIKCPLIYGDARCSSYNGSISTTHEKIPQSLKFKKAIDIYFETGNYPSLRELRNDPTVNFYYTKLKCSFPLIRKDFIPSDIPSGGYRVILEKNLFQ